jgi:hypothetical protein
MRKTPVRAGVFVCVRGMDGERRPLAGRGLAPCTPFRGWLVSEGYGR